MEYTDLTLLLLHSKICVICFHHNICLSESSTSMTSILRQLLVMFSDKMFHVFVLRVLRLYRADIDGFLMRTRTLHLRAGVALMLL